MNESDSPKVLFVDHSGLPGGGQLGLLRFLKSDAGAAESVLVLGAGGLFNSLPKQRVFEMHHGSKLTLPLRLLGSLRKALSASEASVVVANSLRSALAIALVPHKRSVTWIYYLRVDMERSKMSSLRWHLLNQIVLPRFDGFLSNSRWTQSTLPKKFASRPKFVAYPVSGTTPSQAPSERDSNEYGLTVLSLSRVVEWKGVHILVDAVQQLMEAGFDGRVRAIIAGGTFHEDDRYAQQLQERISAGALPIAYLGHQDDVGPLLIESDVLVSCSLVPEPFGQVVAQGLAASLPVIVTEGGGPQEMVENGVNGYVVAPGDAATLAAALRRLLDSPTLLKRLREAAFSSSEQFSDPRTTTLLASAIRAINSMKRTGEC